MTDSSPMNKIVVQTLIKGLEEAKKSMELIQKQVHATELAMSEVKSNYKTLLKDVDQMLKIIRDGNGKEPLIDRVSKLEEESKTHYKELQKILDEKKQTNMENIKGSWQLKVALAAGALSIVGGAINAFLTFFVN